MRIEIIVLAALAAFASAAPQWPYRDAVAPYYYGYPGKTPFMYRSASGDEDDEMDETYLARQDLKVATPGGSSVTVVEDDEKADGIRVVETGSAKPVAQTASNNNQLGLQQDQQPGAPAQAQQPLNNANNAQSANNQPLTVQQPGQQPPQAFPPARPTNAAPAKVKEEEDDDEEEDDSEEDDEDGDDEEDDGDDDDDDDDEEDDEERRRNDVQQKDVSAEEPAQQQQQVVQQPQAVQPVQIVQSSNSESDELVQEEVQPVEQSPPPSQTAVVNNKINKNKHNAAAAAAANAPGAVKPKKKVVSGSKVSGSKTPTGAIEALVPGYVTDQGEVLVPVDTVTGSQPITIVPDPFSPPSRIVGGPRPIPQSAVPSVPHRQVPYWYRSSPANNPLTQGSPLSGQTLYSAVPPPGSIFTFDDDDDDDDIEDSPSIIPGNRLRQDDDDDDDDDDEDEEEDQRVSQAKPPRVPLAAVPASGNSGEDDEAEALAFVNSGKPGGNRRPTATAASGNKKPLAAAGAKEPASVESSEEDESEEDDVDSGEEDEESDIGRGVTPDNRGRMYVDEEYVSFPPSRSPSIFAVVQGRFPVSQQRQQSNIYSTAIPGNPFQRYVVRVTPANRQRPSAGPGPSLYYRPQESSTPNRRVVPVASFDVSVEDTRPPPAFDSDEEEGITVVAPGGAGPTPVTSYPFVYNVQGALHTRGPNGRPPRPSISYYGGSSSGRPRPIFGPGGPRPYGRPSFYPGSSSSINPYAALLGQAAALSFGSSRPPSRISSSSGGPPVIVRRKQSGSGPNRPPKPHLIAVYNPTGSSSSGGPRPREPVEEEYYTFEVPEGNNKFVPGNSGSSSSSHKRPTVHRRPTPVIKQKVALEESSEEDLIPPSGPIPQGLHIIPQGTVRRRIRGGKQLKPKKNPKKTTSSTKKQQQTEDPLGLLSKINKSTKSKVH